jgi:hypothetical protein
MVEQRLEWANEVLRVLYVEDGVEGYSVVLPRSMGADEALADFAAGYDAGEAGVEITVSWSLYENGEETDSGEWSFQSVYPPTRG